MSAWTMVRSDEFAASREDLEKKFDIEAGAVLGALKPSVSRDFRASQISFYEFLDLLDSIESGQRDPEHYLVYVADDFDGLPLYSAVSESCDWRCLYRVDRSTKNATSKGTCTAVEIDHLTSNLKHVEHERHRAGTHLR